MKTVFVTGGAGYIGSHATLAMLKAGYDVVVLDNLHNSSCESLKRVEKIAGRDLHFIRGDIRDRILLNSIFKEHTFDTVFHFAGLKSPYESVSYPLQYYDNNVHGSQELLQAMMNAGVYKFIFSSSASVYGDPTVIPLSETHPLTKLQTLMVAVS